MDRPLTHKYKLEQRNPTHFLSALFGITRKIRAVTWRGSYPGGGGGGGGGGDLVSTLLRCVCRKVKDMGPFSASSE